MRHKTAVHIAAFGSDGRRCTRRQYRGDSSLRRAAVWVRRASLAMLLAWGGVLASSDQTLREVYESLVNDFNESLANRYPFRCPAQPPAPSELQLQPVVLSVFLQRYAQARRDLVALGDKARRVSVPLSVEPVSRQALKFIEQFDPVAAFFAPAVPGPGGVQPLAYELGVHFRGFPRPPETEVGGNHVAQWTFEVLNGEGGVRMGEPRKVLRWRAGDAIVIRLRWAKDAPSIPDADPAQPRLRVVGRDVEFRFEDRWALIALLREQRATDQDVPGSKPGDPTLLKFEFPTRGVDRGASNPGRTKIFMALSMSAVGEKELLELPALPASASLVTVEPGSGAAPHPASPLLTCP